ncbi:potassium transporter CPA [Desulfosarcina widdelii]|uniref:Potassium transporter CPA n=1 Tax=Desulfosarcina widdelii TaxID=947919 RepID=A0A5K7Z7D9_9BACT|nr:cation:proton antiporter [Desulfosarcina widdelii]BBO76069.1 potassium transporter CPA [Desulfosarcina widdelii]
MEAEQSILLSILLAGGLIAVALLTQSVLQKIYLSNVVGFIGIGFLIRLLDSRYPFLSSQTNQVIAFLANIGIICLLFRVGLESNLAGLLRQLRQARLIWLGNTLLSGIFGYVVCYYLLGLAMIPSLVVGVAFTATSVSIPVAVWQEADAIRTPTGELLIDVAELDDISAIVLMALLFAIVPVLMETASFPKMATLARAFLWFLLKLTAFGILCVIFSRYLEQPFTEFLKKLEAGPDLMVTIIGIGFMIAATAGLLGFSVAIGAFFAGLIFSRDTDAVKMETCIESVYELFIPFFFIHLGLGIDPDMVRSALGLGVILMVAAIVGKIFGTLIPARCKGGWKSSTLLAVSMVPRAEIAMVIVQQGYGMGESVVPYPVFAAMVVVTAGTCILFPIVIRWLLRKWPPSDSLE